MKKFAFIYVVLMLACVVPAFSCWIYLSPNDLVKRSDLAIEATVKFPDDIAKTMEEGDTILKLKAKEDVIVPVTFVINRVVKDNGILEKDQKEIVVDVLIMGTGREFWISTDFDYVLFEGEQAVFIFTKIGEGLRLINYPTYKLPKSFIGELKEISI